MWTFLLGRKDGGKIWEFSDRHQFQQDGGGKKRRLKKCGKHDLTPRQPPSRESVCPVAASAACSLQPSLCKLAAGLLAHSPTHQLGVCGRTGWLDVGGSRNNPTIQARQSTSSSQNATKDSIKVKETALLTAEIWKHDVIDTLVPQALFNLI